LAKLQPNFVNFDNFRDGRNFFNTEAENADFLVNCSEPKFTKDRIGQTGKDQTSTLA
jgi:hypothetical protein